MAPSDDSESEDEEEVYLGFAVKPSGSLLRNQFRSQLGGLPPWLDPVQLPLTSELTCRASGMPLRFVMQLYAATGTDDPLSFHRSISLFISPQGTLLSRPGAVRAFRCQLPRVNPYYPSEPPDEGAQNADEAFQRMVAAQPGAREVAPGVFCCVDEPTGEPAQQRPAAE